MPTPRTTGFHHVAIKVHAYDQAIAFYHGLGFSPKHQWGTGDTRGCLLDVGDGNYMEIFAGGPDISHPAWGENAPLIHVAFRTTDVDGMTTLAASLGATITQPPTTVQMGDPATKVIPIYISFVQSPTGEMLEFFSNPPGAL